MNLLGTIKKVFSNDAGSCCNTVSMSEIMELFSGVKGS